MSSPIKVTRPMALAVRQRYLAGERYVDLAQRFHLGHATISAIVTGKHPLSGGTDISRGRGCGA